MYLLDTCVISDFVKGNMATLEKMINCSPSDIAISTVTKMEIEYGLKRIPERRMKIDLILRSLYESIHILPFCQQSASIAAELRYELSKEGMPIGPYDFLIAATALANEMIMVTSDLKEFNKIKSLKVENWRYE